MLIVLIIIKVKGGQPIFMVDISFSLFASTHIIRRSTRKADQTLRLRHLIQTAFPGGDSKTQLGGCCFI